MDDPKQTKLEAGAGLQESRLNTEFLALLEKWGPRVLYVILGVVLLYVGSQWYGRYQEQKTDEAFAALTSASESNDRLQLEAVAEQNADRGAVQELALLNLGRILVQEGATRVQVGVESADGEEPPLLGDDEAEQRFRGAIDEVRAVLDTTRGTKPLLAQQARWLLAAAYMSLGDDAEARAMLEEFKEAAEGAGVVEAQRAAADARLALIDRGGGAFTLLTADELPEHARPIEAPAASTTGANPLGGMGAGSMTGGDPFAGSGLELGTDGDEAADEPTDTPDEPGDDDASGDGSDAPADPPSDDEG